MEHILKESSRDPKLAFYRQTVKAGTAWTHTLKRGEVLRIVDLQGNQSVDTLLYNPQDPGERYDVNNTISAQRNSMIGLGTEIRSNLDRVMLTVIADTCGEHDTLGSGCSAEGNTIRYTDKTRYMHSCRDTFVGAFLENNGLCKREQTCNLNFFTKVLLDSEGRLEFADGISGPGKYVELKAEMDVTLLVSNCSQMNNPCNDYNPTPVEMIIWDK
ncbi:MAG: urea carboxylase-associated family protein [Victivallales bacterium]|jgi:urea carboxylase-associated protein 1|nr:urea carboxylase-associated family protein [Victivallales bacterium]